MSRLENILSGVLLLIGLLLMAALGVRHYGAVQYRAGHAAAITEGDAIRARQAEANRQTESDLRAQLHAKDADALKKEQDHAASLEAAQRRVRVGTDRLLCPTSAVSAGSAPDGRPAAAGIVIDAGGPQLMPETAADLLGVAGDVAGLVRRYERVIERFEACRALNSVP